MLKKVMYDIKKGMPNFFILRKWITHSRFFKSIILFLVYTTQVKSDFAHTDWLVQKWITSTIHLWVAHETKLHLKSLIPNHLSVYIERNKLTCFNICVVYSELQ